MGRKDSEQADLPLVRAQSVGETRTMRKRPIRITSNRCLFSEASKMLAGGTQRMPPPVSCLRLDFLWEETQEAPDCGCLLGEKPGEGRGRVRVTDFHYILILLFEFCTMCILNQSKENKKSKSKMKSSTMWQVL